MPASSCVAGGRRIRKGAKAQGKGILGKLGTNGKAELPFPCLLVPITQVIGNAISLRSTHEQNLQHQGRKSAGHIKVKHLAHFVEDIY